MKKLAINAIEDTQRIARAIAALVKPVDTIVLQGDLGAGKTTFARSLIQTLLKDSVDVTSPTFNLVHYYDSNEYDISHFDLYRLEHADELVALDIAEAIETNIVIIEWPELARDYMPEDYIQCDLGFDSDQNRTLTLTGFGSWATQVEHIL